MATSKQKHGAAGRSASAETVELSLFPTSFRTESLKAATGVGGTAAAAGAIGMGLAAQSATAEGLSALQDVPAEASPKTDVKSGVGDTSDALAAGTASDAETLAVDEAMAADYVAPNVGATDVPVLDVAATVRPVTIDPDGGTFPFATESDTPEPSPVDVARASAAATVQTAREVASVVIHREGSETPSQMETESAAENDQVAERDKGGEGVLENVLETLNRENGVVDSLLDTVAGEDGIVDAILGEDGVVNGLLDVVAGEDGLLDSVLDVVTGDDGLVGSLTETVLGDDGIVNGLLEGVAGEDGVVSGILGTVTGSGGLLGGLLGGGWDEPSTEDPVTAQVDDVAAGIADSVLSEDGLVDGALDAATDDGGAVDMVADVVADEDGVVSGLLDTVAVEDDFLESLLADDGGPDLLEGLLGDDDVYAVDVTPEALVGEDDLFVGLGSEYDLSGTLVDEGMIGTASDAADAEIDDLLISILGSPVDGDITSAAFSAFDALLDDVLGAETELGSALEPENETLFGDDAVDSAMSALFGGVVEESGGLLGGLGTEDENS